MPDSGAETASRRLSDSIESANFTVFSRIAATKPLHRAQWLLTPSADKAAARPIGPPESEDGDNPNAYLHISTAVEPSVFGIRLGINVSDARTIIAVDAAIEYQWSEEVDYSQSDIEGFVRLVAAPRVTIAAWTVMQELARSIGSTLNDDMAVPHEAVAEATLKYFSIEGAPDPGGARRQSTNM